MKKIITLLAVILFGVSALTASAQTKTSNPIVPIVTTIKGRAAVTEDLLGQIDHAVLHYSGRSIIGNGWNDQYLDSYALQAMGYTHKGSFTELSAAIYSRAYNGDVIRTPDGNYEVTVEITFYTSDGRVALHGNGYLQIYEQPDGNLIAGEFNPYVDINYIIETVFPGYISGAKWTGKNGRSLDLAVLWDGKNSFIQIPVGNLENGFLVLADSSGGMSGWDLTNGDLLSGERIYALIGIMRSSAVRVVGSQETIDAFGNQFYLWNDQIVGRYPVLDIKTSQAINRVIPMFKVPVWNMNDGIEPSRIFVKPVYFDGATGGHTKGEEFELQYYPAAGGFILTMLANCGFHIRVEFPGVSDWDEQSQGGAVGVGKG